MHFPGPRSNGTRDRVSVTERDGDQWLVCCSCGGTRAGWKASLEAPAVHGAGGTAQSLLPMPLPAPLLLQSPSADTRVEQALCIAGGHLTRPVARVTALPASPTAEAAGIS